MKLSLIATLIAGASAFAPAVQKSAVSHVGSYAPASKNLDDRTHLLFFL